MDDLIDVCVGHMVNENWVEHTEAWVIPGTEELQPYINQKDRLGKWYIGTVGFAALSAILAGMMTLIL